MRRKTLAVITVRKTGAASDAGAAAVEFALIAPVLALLLVAVVEIGFAIRQQMQVQDSVAAGALYAAQNGWNASGIATAVTGAVANSAVSASPAPALFCGCPTSTAVTAAVCGATCADGLVARRYVLISAAVTRTSFVSSSLSLPTTLTATATTRIP